MCSQVTFEFVLREALKRDDVDKIFSAHCRDSCGRSSSLSQTHSAGSEVTG